jgi:hypothetical protein
LVLDLLFFLFVLFRSLFGHAAETAVQEEHYVAEDVQEYHQNVDVAGKGSAD